MADSNARPHVQTLWEASHGHPLPDIQAFKPAHPELFNNNVPPAPIPRSILASLATLPASGSTNPAWIPPDRRVSPREPSSPRPAPIPPSPQEATKQAVRDQIALADQQEAWLQELLQLQQERAEALQRVASLQHKLQAKSQPVRFCRHCYRPLYIHLPDGTLEPCTRSNRFNCGYVSHEMGEKLLVGYLDCIKGRNATKGRRKYAARKAREQAGTTAPALYVVDGKARPH